MSLVGCWLTPFEITCFTFAGEHDHQALWLDEVWYVASIILWHGVHHKLSIVPKNHLQVNFRPPYEPWGVLFDAN